jgi:hypothetical protein
MRALLGALATASLALALAPTAGCVVVMPPLEHGEHCAFVGSGACATCLASSCQASIDACCSDKACAGDDGHSAVLDAVDACGGGDAAACAAHLGDAQGKSAGVGAVRACVTTTCRAACLGDVPVPVRWSCEAPRAANDNACARCVLGQAPGAGDDAGSPTTSAPASATPATSCASALAECCDDASCQKSTSLADDVGRCVSGDAPGCAFLTTRSMSGFEGKVRACITKTCATECMGDGRLHESCSLEGGGAYCSCSDAEASGGAACSGAKVDGSDGTCVLGEKGCTCGHYACERSGSSASGGCSCDFRNGPGGSTRCDVARTNTGSGTTDGVCCIKREDRGFSCACVDYLSSCLGTGEYETPTCDLADVMPRLKNVLVSACSN